MAENDIEALAVELERLSAGSKSVGLSMPGEPAYLMERDEKEAFAKALHATLIDNLPTILTALRSTTAEPVAWMYEYSGVVEYQASSMAHHGHYHGWAETPLYTHPTDSAAKDAEIVEGEPVHPAEAIMYQQEDCIGRLEAQNLALCEALEAAANSLNSANVLIKALSGNKSIMVETQEERTRAALANRGEAGALAKDRSE